MSLPLPPLYATEFLYNPSLGIYLVTTYWSDGSITEELVPKGPGIIFNVLEI